MTFLARVSVKSLIISVALFSYKDGLNVVGWWLKNWWLNPELIRRLVTLHSMQSAVRGRCRLNAK